MGDLVTQCCDDPAYAGQGWSNDETPDSSVAAATLVPGTSIATAANPATSSGSTAIPSGLPTPGVDYPLTPVDIITGTWGMPIAANGKPWPRPRLPQSARRNMARAFPNFGPGVSAQSLVPPCPCFSSAPPVAVPVPAVVTPAPAAAPKPACPYPGCSTGNVCLDLVTGCVSDSQVTLQQQEACALANYGNVFGNSGAWLSAILVGCGTNLPYLGTPMPNPPQASASMLPTLQAAEQAGQAANKAAGLAGFGQDDGSGTSNLGGFLAIVAAAGLLWWATRKM